MAEEKIRDILYSTVSGCPFSEVFKKQRAEFSILLCILQKASGKMPELERYNLSLFLDLVKRLATAF